MLSAFVVMALAVAFCMDVLRARALATAGREVDRVLAPAALRSVLRDAAGPSRRMDHNLLRDVAKLRSLLSGSAVHALFDAPWLPVYLTVIVVMHPLLIDASGVLAGSIALDLRGGAGADVITGQRRG